MARVSISLPEELVARLEPIKDRINISQVCREALERRIATFERASGQDGDDLDVEGLISRLREERALVDGKWEQLGRRNAALWLDTMSYPELKEVVGQQSVSNMARYRLPRAAFWMMKRDMRQANGDLEGPPAVAYKTAWLDHVQAVWAQIQHRVEQTKDPQPPEAQATE